MKHRLNDIADLIRRGPVFGIRTRISLLFAFAIGIFAFLVAVYFPQFHQQREMKALRERAQSVAAISAYSISPALYFDDATGLSEVVDAARQDKDIILLEVKNNAGKVVASYVDKSAGGTVDTLAPASLPGYTLVTPIVDRGNRIGTLTVVMSVAGIEKSVSDTRQVIGIVSLVIFIIGIFFGGWIGKLITAQLSTIAQTTELIAAGDLSKRVPVGSQDEVGVFARSFNLMVEKLGATMYDLADVNRNLERRVQIRTAELQHEIVERRKIEDELRKLYVAVDQSSVSVAITDTKGVIEYVNPKFTTTSGYTREEITGQPISILKSGLTPHSVYKYLWDTILAGNEWSGDLQNRRKNGELYWENVTISPIRDPDGIVANFLAVKDDITEKRRLEQQLTQAQKMESIGTLAGGIAHDFNNILTIISGYASLIGTVHQQDSDTQKNVRMITTAVDRGAGIVRQILTFARKTEARPKLVEVNTVIKELSSLLRDTFPKTITVALNLEKALPRIVIDGTQLHQMLLNLCVNARDAMEDGGTLTMSTRLAGYADLEAKFPDCKHVSHVQINVSDTGMGMTGAITQRIFEPFFTTKEIGKGTGLGLSVVYGIVRAHGGYVDVESAPGQGSTFRVYLPVQDDFAPDHDQAGKTALTSLSGNETILLVEDEEGLRQMLRSSLSKYGYRILEAKDGLEAVEVFRRNAASIDLLFTDIGLPGLDGLSVIREVRAIKPTIKVLASSGFLNPELRVSLAQQSITEFLQKPFLPEQVLERVRHVLSGMAL